MDVGRRPTGKAPSGSRSTHSRRPGHTAISPSQGERMSAGKMHADKLHIDVSLVGRLLAAQFPQWADLPIEPVHSTGADNAIYRPGDDMGVRLPLNPGAPGEGEKGP